MKGNTNIDLNGRIYLYMSFLRCGQKRINGFFRFSLFFLSNWTGSTILVPNYLGYLVSDILGMPLRAK